MPHDATGPQSAYATATAQLFELRTSPPTERADAARNRAAVLAAAARLFSEHGVANVSMDSVAAAAGVGKGTLFRRFGDKAGLAAALLDDRERQLQEQILSGPPPLGPGTTQTAVTPRQRIHAFLDAYLDYALAHLELIAMSETAAPGARYRVGAYRFWHHHLNLLLAAAHDHEPDADSRALAHTTLAPLAAEHLRAVTSDVGTDQVRRAIHTIAPVPALP